MIFIGSTLHIPNLEGVSVAAILLLPLTPACDDEEPAPEPTVTVLEETTPALFNDGKLVERVVPVFCELMSGFS